MLLLYSLSCACWHLGNGRLCSPSNALTRRTLGAGPPQEEAPESLSDVILIDFQILSVSDIANDVISFFLSNLSPELLVRLVSVRHSSRATPLAHMPR